MNPMTTDEKVEALYALTDLANRIFSTAEESGWHDTNRPLPESLALIHSEVSEALEEYRSLPPNFPLGHTYYRYGGDISAASEMDGVLGKPEGIASELADVMIRILDAAVEFDIPVNEVLLQKMAYNETRPYRHGNKRA